MTNERQGLYLELIDELLKCPNGEEPNVLNAKIDLIDEDFVRTLIHISTVMTHEGQVDAAKFLVHVARELAKELGVYPQLST
ncbi:MAG: hypothetical protein SFW36_13935 [Leptolyngbyaceae cyanobacterium bins.59]|nr:hypothetical protein [Leptolyngbyaceae cyanobacterium bins.59]